MNKEIEKVLEEQFPKGDKSRGKALVLHAVAQIQLEKAVEAERELIKLLDEYIKLLESEVSRVGGLSIVKPYLQANPTKVAKGEELRTKIKAIRGK